MRVLSPASGVERYHFYKRTDCLFFFIFTFIVECDLLYIQSFEFCFYSFPPNIWTGSGCWFVFLIFIFIYFFWPADIISHIIIALLSCFSFLGSAGVLGLLFFWVYYFVSLSIIHCILPIFFHFFIPFFYCSRHTQCSFRGSSGHCSHSPPTFRS